MIGLLRRAPAKRAGRPSRAFLNLEEFDGRATPSGAGVPPPITDTAPVQDGQAGAACQIVNFSAQQISNGVFVISGQVVDANPAGLTVNFTGDPVDLNGTSVTTDENGYFSETVTLTTDGNDVGWLYAQTTDAAGNVSNEPSVYVQPTP